jgi:hypothetical protein
MADGRSGVGATPAGPWTTLVGSPQLPARRRFILGPSLHPRDVVPCPPPACELPYILMVQMLMADEARGWRGRNSRPAWAAALAHHFAPLGRCAQGPVACQPAVVESLTKFGEVLLRGVDLEGPRRGRLHCRHSVASVALTARGTATPPRRYMQGVMLLYAGPAAGPCIVQTGRLWGVTCRCAAGSPAALARRCRTNRPL